MSPRALTWPGLQASLLLSALRRHEVEFVVLGSVARVLRGDLGRTPHDLDIAPEQSDENIEGLPACLNELGVYGNRVPLVRQQVVVALFRETGRGTARKFRSRFGWIEICLSVGAANTYADLRSNAMAVDVGGCMVLVATLRDLDRYDAARPPARG